VICACVPCCCNTSRAVKWYRGADKSLARPGRKQARKHVKDARDFNNIETRAVIKFLFFPARQGAEGNSRHSDKNISFFLPGRAKDSPAPLYIMLPATYLPSYSISCTYYWSFRPILLFSRTLRRAYLKLGTPPPIVGPLSCNQNRLQHLLYWFVMFVQWHPSVCLWVCQFASGVCCVWFN